MFDNLHWLGHASFRLEGRKIIYFDPWKVSPGSKKADIIFISHEHFDHFSLDDVRALSAKDTVVITCKSVGRELLNKKTVLKEVKSLSPGDAVEVFGVLAKAVASYNINKQFHTKGSQKLGFIVSAEGARIYHAGDTDKIPEMEDYACDIALLPVSGTYVMTAEEAVQAALLIKPKLAIPMHYADIVGTVDDAKRFGDLLKGKIEVSIPEKES